MVQALQLPEAITPAWVAGVATSLDAATRLPPSDLQKLLPFEVCVQLLDRCQRLLQAEPTLLQVRQREAPAPRRSATALPPGPHCCAPSVAAAGDVGGFRMGFHEGVAPLPQHSSGRRGGTPLSPTAGKRWVRRTLPTCIRPSPSVRLCAGDATRGRRWARGGGRRHTRTVPRRLQNVSRACCGWWHPGGDGW